MDTTAYRMNNKVSNNKNALLVRVGAPKINNLVYNANIYLRIHI